MYVPWDQTHDCCSFNKNASIIKGMKIENYHLCNYSCHLKPV